MTPQTIELLDRLRHGVFDPKDTAMLEQIEASQWVSELQSVYRWTFQERRLRNKWEVSVARSFRGELAAHPFPDSLLVSFSLLWAYRDCLMLSIEGNFVTGISRLARLTVRPVRKPVPGLALTTGGGFKLDKLPDGWTIKRMRRRTVQLAESFLQQRGWRFDQLSRLAPR